MTFYTDDRILKMKYEMSLHRQLNFADYESYEVAFLKKGVGFIKATLFEDEYGENGDDVYGCVSRDLVKRTVDALVGPGSDYNFDKKMVEFDDGTAMSIQASRGHYCSPRYAEDFVEYYHERRSNAKLKSIPERV